MKRDLIIILIMNIVLNCLQSASTIVSRDSISIYMMASPYTESGHLVIMLTIYNLLISIAVISMLHKRIDMQYDLAAFEIRSGRKKYFRHVFMDILKYSIGLIVVKLISDLIIIFIYEPAVLNKIADIEIAFSLVVLIWAFFDYLLRLLGAGPQLSFILIISADLLSLLISVRLKLASVFSYNILYQSTSAVLFRIIIIIGLIIAVIAFRKNSNVINQEGEKND